MKDRLPKDALLRTLLVNWLIGFCVAVIILAALLWFDTAHLWTLLSTASDPVTPAILLFLGLLVTLTSVAMGTAIMSMPYDNQDGPDKGSREVVVEAEDLIARAEPALVRVAARRRR